MRCTIGSCKCGKWGHVTPTFDERKWFLRCDCGQTMFLMRNIDPREYGLSFKDEIVPCTYPIPKDA